jgi:AcrR family transcriptional regulator
MSERVNRAASRRYDSTRRLQQAGENRKAVLAAARHRFLDQGYAATTLGEIAADAGVSVQMVYKAFSNKAGLLKALFDVSVAGDDQPIPMADRDLILTITLEPDPIGKIAKYTEHLAQSMPRVAPIQLLARDAAAADAGAAEVWAQTRRETFTAMTLFAANLAETGQLQVSVHEARDILWTYHAPEMYELLVLQRAWTPKRYGRFLAGALTAVLVSESSSPAS